MADILRLLLKKVISSDDLLLWLQDPNNRKCPEVLQSHLDCQREFVPVFLNFLRYQVNSVVLCHSSQQCSKAAPTSAFPLEAIKYISPCKASVANRRGGQKSHVVKLNFATPSRGKPQPKSSNNKLNSLVSSCETSNMNCLDTLLEQDSFEASMLESHRVLQNQLKSTPHADKTFSASFGDVATSTPRADLSSKSDNFVYDNKPANWNRRESSEFLSTSRNNSCDYNKQDDSFRRNYNTPVSKNYIQIEYKNSVSKSKIYPASGNKKGRRKYSAEVATNEFNQCNGVNISAIPSPDVSDLQSFPPMNAGNSSKPEKSAKKKRIKPIRVPNPKNLKNDPSENYKGNINVATAFSNASESAVTSLEQERLLLKQFKKKSIPVNETKNAKSENSDTKNVKSENSETKNVKSENSETKNAKSENSETKNVKSENSETKNAKIENSETKNVKSENSETKNVKSENSYTLEKGSRAINCNEGHSKIVAEKSECIKEEISLEHVTYCEELNSLVEIYSGLVLSNSIPSLMMELIFSFQLLTVKEIQAKNNVSGEFDDIPLLFSSLPNCIYFASHFLSSIKEVVHILDRSVIKLLLETKRLQLFTFSFHECLSSLVDVALPLPSPQQAPKSPMKSVPFQIETDNRGNFPDNSTFHIFKKQRDIFYELLREWEHEHHSPGWSLPLKLGTKIRNLLELGPEPCNVAHLARLFVDQLLSMCDTSASLSQEDVSSSILTQLRRLQPEKFERLQHRLVVPSKVSNGFTPSPSFPGVQHFFRGFLLEAYNPTFYTHLEDILVARLLQVLGIEEENSFFKKSSVGISLWLRQCGTLSKFIGVLFFSSYYSPLSLPQAAVSHQLNLRNKKQLSISLTKVLECCALKGRLVAGVLTCVQLMSVADNIGLHTTPFLTPLCVLIYIYKMAVIGERSNKDAQDCFKDSLEEGNCHSNLMTSSVTLRKKSIQEDINKDCVLFDEENLASPLCPAPSDNSLLQTPQRKAKLTTKNDEDCKNTQDFTTPKHVRRVNFLTLMSNNSPSEEKKDLENYLNQSAALNGKKFLKFNEDIPATPSCTKGQALTPQVCLFLRLLLGWLFDLPIFPDGLFYANPFQMDINIQEYKKTVEVISSLFGSASEMNISSPHTTPSSSKQEDAFPFIHQTSRKKELQTHSQPTPSHKTCQSLGRPFVTPQKGPPVTPIRAGLGQPLTGSAHKGSPALPSITFQDTPDHKGSNGRRPLGGVSSSSSSTFDSVINIDYQLLQEWCPQVTNLKVILTNYNQHASARRLPLLSAVQSEATTVPCVRTIKPFATANTAKGAKADRRADALRENHKHIQHMLEESFFHTQPKCVLECVEFVAGQFINNAVRALRAATIPKLVQEYSKVVQEQLTLSLEAENFENCEDVESQAKTFLEKYTVKVKEAVREKCMHAMGEQLNNARQKSILSSLLPSDTSQQAVEVCSSVLHRVCLVRLRGWLDANLDQAVPSDLLSSAAVKAVRNVTHKKNNHQTCDSTAVDIINNSSVNLQLSSNSSKCDPKDAPPASPPTEAKGYNSYIYRSFSAKAGGANHVTSAPAPSTLMNELKDILKDIERCPSNSIKITSSLADSATEFSESLNGLYRERSLKKSSKLLKSDHLLHIYDAISMCVTARGDLTQPVLRGLKALSVDIVVCVSVLSPHIISDKIIDKFVCLWKEGGLLECPQTLLSTILAPRMLALVEAKRGGKKWHEKLLSLLHRCLQANLLQKEELQQKCLELLQHSWHQDVLKGLSTIIQQLKVPKDEVSVISWLPWICEEMEDFPDVF